MKKFRINIVAKRHVVVELEAENEAEARRGVLFYQLPPDPSSSQINTIKLIGGNVKVISDTGSNVDNVMTVTKLEES